MQHTKISSISGHRVKVFEKEIRRFLQKHSVYEQEVHGELIRMSTFNAYVFKGTVDHMYKDSELGLQDDIEAINMLIFYSFIFTLRNLKTDSLVTKSDDGYEEFQAIIDNNSVFNLHIYDQNFLHKPQNPFCTIICAINKKRRAIIPMNFTVNLGEFYPKWFGGKLSQRDKIEVGTDFELLERIKAAMS